MSEISVEIHYPNASPEVVESELAFKVESALAGISGLRKMRSHSSYGRLVVGLKFSEGVDIATTIAAVREKIAMVRGDLPSEIKEPHIYEEGGGDRAFYYVSLTNNYSKPEEVSHFAEVYISRHLSSVPGVAKVEVWGARHVIEIILDKKKLYLYRVNVAEVLEKLKTYNVDLPAGRIDDAIPITIDLASNSPSDFAEIVIRESGNGVVKLGDVADIKLGSTNDLNVRVGGKPGVIVAITKTSSSNPLDVSDLISKKLEKIAKTLPRGYVMETEEDGSDFVRASLKNVRNAIIEAVILVVLIIFAFLRSVRAALIPLITIPICVAGGIAILQMLGFSLNTLTLLAIVLSIGLVVDDAIVVLENIYRHMESGKSPLQAAIDGSSEIGFAVVAMTLTLASVFIPIALISGTIGKLFIEFAVALSGSVIVSGIVALTLSPVLSARLLKQERGNALQGVEKLMQALEIKYKKVLQGMLGRRLLLSIISAMILLGNIGLYYLLPKEMAPEEDRGLIGIFIPKIANISKEQFEPYSLAIERAIKDTTELKKLFAFSYEVGSQIMAKLKDSDLRQRRLGDIVSEFEEKVKSVPSVQAFVWGVDSGLPGLEQSHEGKLGMSVRTTATYPDLLVNLERIVAELRKNGLFSNVSHGLEVNSLGYELKFNKYKLTQLGIQPQSVSDLLSISFGDKYVQSFLKGGLSYNVNMKFAQKPQSIDEIYLFTKDREPVSLGSIATMTMEARAMGLEHRDQMRAAGVRVVPKPGTSMDAALEEMQKVVEGIDMPDITVTFTEALEKFKSAKLQMLVLLFLAIFFIYSVLAIQFESFIDPLVVIITVPLASLGALLFVMLHGGSLNIFSQIGLITLIGLIAKHGIMIVEFANKLRSRSGISAIDAVVKAASLRLRPILMTTFAMVFGSLPLVLSSGAGSEARKEIGYVLVGGLSLGTLLTMIIIPFIYVVLANLIQREKVSV